MRVFISYRREDTSGQAGRLYDALADKLGADNVFMDVDTIDIGVEFKHAIEAAVSSCDVLFVMIGPRWLTAADTRGERRLSRTDDYVRLEVETALGRNIRVVPALVAGAAMPVADDLPGTLSALTLRNAVEMADGPRWQYDVSRLMNLLERIRAGESHAEARAADRNLRLRLGEGDHGRTGSVGVRRARPRPRARATTENASRAARRKAETIRRASRLRASTPAGTASRRRDATALRRRRRAVRKVGTARAAAGRAVCRTRRNGSSRSPAWASSPSLALALFGAYQLGNDRSGGSASTASRRRPSAHGRHLADDGQPASPAHEQHGRPGKRRCRPDQALARDPEADPARFVQVREHRARRRRGHDQLRLSTIRSTGARSCTSTASSIPLISRSIYKLHGPGSVAAHGGTPDPQLKNATGGCNRTLWRGEGPWSHETGGGVMGPVSGRYSCYQADGQCDLVAKMKLTDVNGSTCSVIVWTDTRRRPCS